jgi:hypothetical protein
MEVGAHSDAHFQLVSPDETKAEARSDAQIQGHPFLAKSIGTPKFVAGIERNPPAHVEST